MKTQSSLTVIIQYPHQQFLNNSHQRFHELLTAYSHMQCEFQNTTNIFHDQDTVEIVEEFFGTFAIFLNHFEVKIHIIVGQHYELKTHSFIKEIPRSLH